MAESSGEDGQGRDSFINIRKNPNIDKEKKEEEKEENPCRMMPPLQKKAQVQESKRHQPNVRKKNAKTNPSMTMITKKDEKVARTTKPTANSNPRRRAEESITGKEVRSRLRLPSHILELIRGSLYLASLGEEDFGRVCRTLIHNGIVVSCRA